MVAAFEHDEFRAGNVRRQKPALLERLHAVVAGMDDQRRHGDLSDDIRDIEAIDRGPESSRVFWRCRLALQIDQREDLFLAAAGMLLYPDLWLNLGGGALFVVTVILNSKFANPADAPPPEPSSDIAVASDSD